MAAVSCVSETIGLSAAFMAKTASVAAAAAAADGREGSALAAGTAETCGRDWTAAETIATVFPDGVVAGTAVP